MTSQNISVKKFHVWILLLLLLLFLNLHNVGHGFVEIRALFKRFFLFFPFSLCGFQFEKCRLGVWSNLAFWLPKLICKAP